MPSISFIKFANPITKLETKKSILFKSTKDEDEYEEISDDVLRLYLTVDCIYISGELYCFNQAFEKPFGLESTVKLAKNQAIDKIVGKDFIADNKIFEEAAQSYNARTLLSINDDRLQSLVDIEKRKGYAQWQGIALDSNEKLILTTLQQANEIIKYICLKIIREYDTDEIYEITNAVRITSPTT